MCNRMFRSPHIIFLDPSLWWIAWVMALLGHRTLRACNCWFGRLCILPNKSTGPGAPSNSKTGNRGCCGYCESSCETAQSEILVLGPCCRPVDVTVLWRALVSKLGTARSLSLLRPYGTLYQWSIVDKCGTLVSIKSCLTIHFLCMSF